MPRRSRKLLKAREEEAQRQMLALLSMTSVNLSDEDLRQVEEEIQRVELMTDAELQVYYSSSEGLADIACAQEVEQTFKQLEATPIEQRPNLLGRKLLRSGKLEFYQQIHTRVVKGVPRKVIADELGIASNCLNALFRLSCFAPVVFFNPHTCISIQTPNLSCGFLRRDQNNSKFKISTKVLLMHSGLQGSCFLHLSFSRFRRLLF